MYNWKSNDDKENAAYQAAYFDRLVGAQDKHTLTGKIKGQQSIKPMLNQVAETAEASERQVAGVQTLQCNIMHLTRSCYFKCLVLTHTQPANARGKSCPVPLISWLIQESPSCTFLHEPGNERSAVRILDNACAHCHVQGQQD